MVVFGALAAVAASFELTKGKNSSSENASKEFWKFRTNYTLVYALMMGAVLWHHSPFLFAVTSKMCIAYEKRTEWGRARRIWRFGQSWHEGHLAVKYL